MPMTCGRRGNWSSAGACILIVLEIDREFGQEEMKSVGMLTLPHWDFDNFGAAIEFLKTNAGAIYLQAVGGRSR